MSMQPPKWLRFVPDLPYSIEQSQQIEKVTGHRYEYHGGYLVSVEAMAGGSFNHSVLGINVGHAVLYAFEEAGEAHAHCASASSDLRIAIDSGTRYLYADPVIVCGEPEYDPIISTAIVNPITVFEVLSPSSEKYDTGRKFDFHGGLDSVREYVLVHQDKRHVEIRHRADAASPWRYTICADVDGAVPLPSLDVELSMRRIYRNWKAPETDD